MNTMHELFTDMLKDVHSAETQIVEALPKMAEKATSQELRQALELHLDESREQIARLDRIMQMLGTQPSGNPCEAMQGLLQEGEEILSRAQSAEVRDAGIIAAAQAVEHYEIARYGTLAAWAEQLGLDDAQDLLEETLEEEKATDEKLNDIALMSVNEKAQA